MVTLKVAEVGNNRIFFQLMCGMLLIIYKLHLLSMHKFSLMVPPYRIRGSDMQDCPNRIIHIWHDLSMSKVIRNNSQIMT